MKRIVIMGGDKSDVFLPLFNDFCKGFVVDRKGVCLEEKWNTKSGQFLTYAYDILLNIVLHSPTMKIFFFN